MSDVHIRAAAPRDIAAITRIYADAVRHGTATFEVEPPDEAEMARRMQAIVAGNYPYLVAERSGAVAGYARMPALITFAQLTAGPLRISSISSRNFKDRE